jgi:hypothetical protein
MVARCDPISLSDMRDLGAVLDHEGSLGERRLTVAATKAFHASSCF